jgi:uncharacterized membrane protein YfhO
MNILFNVLDLDGVAPLSTLKIRTKLLMYWAIYTVLFAMIFIIVFRVVFSKNLTFIQSGDGIDYDVVSIKYQSEYLRTIISNILSGKFQIPMFDFRMGLGNDISQAMGNATRREIYSSLSVFFPSRYEEFLSNTFVFHVYLAGLTFSVFCMYARRKYWAILLGSLCYAFNGGYVISHILGPMFPLVYTPIMFMGLDFILRKKKPFLFILSVFLMAITGFYYLFMVTVFFAVYAFIRVHHLYGKTFWKQLVPLALRAASSFILGLMMSAIIFLPTVLGYLDSNRTGIQGNLLKSERYRASSLLFFNIDVIIDRLFFSLTYKSLLLPSIVLIAIILLFTNKSNKNDKYHLIAFFFFAFMVYITPLGNLFMNGFAYINERWVFLFIFILCFITVYKLPRMLDLKAKEMIVIYALIGFFGFYGIVNNYVTQATVFFMLSFTAVCISTLKTTSQAPGMLALPAAKIRAILILSAAVIINLIVIDVLGLYWATSSYTRFVKKGSTNKMYSELPNVPESVKAKDVSFYRLDTPMNLNYTNAPLFLDYNGISIYLSMVNRYVTEALMELENISMQATHRIYNFNSRTVLNALSSVKYYAEKGTGAINVPFGYSLFDVDETSLQNTYQNDYALPLGYTYDKSISYDEYRTLNALEKQEAMLQAVVLNPEHANAKIDDLQFTIKEIPYKYKLNWLTWDNGILTGYANNASLTLSFSGTGNSETYMRLSGFFDTGDLFTHNIQFDKEQFIQLSTHFSHYLDRNGNYLYNCGYSEDGRTSATLVFDRATRFMLEDIKVYCYPMDNYPEQVMALKNEPLENINVTTNRVTGEISVSKDKYLVLSIPWSKGWSAKVDGNSAGILRANTMFMALPLAAGNHAIELDYCTPGIKLGALLSAIGFAMLICLWLLQKRFDKLQ